MQVKWETRGNETKPLPFFTSSHKETEIMTVRDYMMKEENDRMIEGREVRFKKKNQRGEWINEAGRSDGSHTADYGDE